MAIYTATATISCPHERCPVSASATGHSTESMADAQRKADEAAKSQFDSANHANHDG
jgi:hypothetical protein